MVDWAPSSRVALTQQLSVLKDATLSDEACYGRGVAALKTVVHRLRHDDTVTHVFRRQLLHANVIRSYLVPVLLHEEQPYQLQDLALSLLESLSTPEENLQPSQAPPTGLSPEVSIQLSLGLRNLKEALSTPEAARALLTQLWGVLARHPAGDVHGRSAECVSLTLSLLRNLLHGPLSSDSADVTRYRNLLWALFSARLGPALNQLMQSPNLEVWAVPLVELLAQLYKMYASSHLHKTLQDWLHPMQSDSSEGDESNTSPPDLGVERPADARPPEPPPLAPSTDEVFEGAPPAPPGPKAVKRKLSAVRAQKRQVEQIVSSSTSSDEGRFVKLKRPAPPAARCHHKIHRLTKTKHHHHHAAEAHHEPAELPPLFLSSEPAAAPAAAEQAPQPAELSPPPPQPQQPAQPSPAAAAAAPAPEQPESALEPCLRLLRSTRKRAQKILALVTRDPSQGDVDTVIVEFTIQFLMTGCSPLVSALMRSLPDKSDKSHLYWIVVYFMKPITELRISSHTVKDLVCPELMTLLTYEATRLVGIVANLPASMAERFHYQRQIHMLTNTIREILCGMEAMKGYAAPEQAVEIERTLCQLGSLSQFRQLMLLLISQCRMDPASLPYLRDLVLTNHLLISTQEVVNKDFPLVSHVLLFAEPTVILRYTTLLKFYATNPPVLNDALFTVLHHVVGAAGRIELLFQPAVLKTFSEILASELPLMQDWLDLIEYTIHQFVERQHEQSVRAALLSDSATDPASMLGGPAPRVETSLSASLQRLSPTSSGRGEALQAMCAQLAREAAGAVSAHRVLERLLQLQLVPPGQYVEIRNQLPDKADEPAVAAVLESGRMSSVQELTTSAACLRALQHPAVDFQLDCVRRELDSGCLCWLQSELLEVCLVRLLPSAGRGLLPEPVPLHSHRHGRSCPLVPFTGQQIRTVNSQTFVRLLRILRLQGPTTDCVYPTVPPSLPSCYLFAVAQRVAPLDTASLRFDPAVLDKSEEPAEPAAGDTEEMMMMTCVAADLPPPPFMVPARPTNWMAMVSKQKAAMAARIMQITPSGSSEMTQSSGDVSMDEEEDPYGPVSSASR